MIVFNNTKYFTKERGEKRMEENKVTKISLSTFFLILSLIIIIVMGIFIYKFYNEKTEATRKSAELQTQVNNLNETVSNLQGKIDNISETINSDNSDENTTIENNSTPNTTTNNDGIAYTITTRDEIYATIKATKDGKTVSKEFEMAGMIDKTGTMDIKEIGKVALVSYSGGEACVVHVYQLVNTEIKLLGTIDCGADMVKEATYTVETKDEAKAVIKAKRNSETITNEFEMSAAIANTSVVDIFDYGKVVLVAESGGEYYGIQVYRLSQDYTTGKTKEIKNVGSIQHNI